jgi:nitroreductase
MTPSDGSHDQSVSALLEKLDGIHRRIAERAIFEQQPVLAYRPDDVEPGTVKRLVRAATMAPTTRHHSPWAFAIVQDREVLRRYSARVSANPGGTPAAALDDDVFHHAGTLVVICSKLPARAGEAECWLAAENLMLAAHSMGLGTCCVNAALPLLNTPDVKQDLQIPPDITAVAAVVVGVPAEAPAVRVRAVPEILAWKRQPGTLVRSAAPEPRKRVPLSFHPSRVERTAG